MRTKKEKHEKGNTYDMVERNQQRNKTKRRKQNKTKVTDVWKNRRGYISKHRRTKE